ncbi:MAG: type I-B CRISPR-associated protein Cas5 [Nitrospirae bacterium]|nr:type I-B CRISPR-associated protein Cas5 [Nitrospirota bacterium]
MKLLHVSISAWTATFRLPLLYSGTGLTSPLPPYSTLLGLVGAVAGREISPKETRIGFVFKSSGTAIDLETTQRLWVNNKGRLKSQKDTGLAKRQFHIKPELDLYLDNSSYKRHFEYPVNLPCLGRSQDLAWIRKVEEIEVDPVEEGTVRGTLIPFPEPNAAGLILLLPDYFDNSEFGYAREIGKLGKYQAVKYDTPANIWRKNLFKLQQSDKVIYLHSLQ